MKDGIWNEYNSLINRINSIDTWAHQFVALYFAFSSGIMTALGFSFVSRTKLNVIFFKIFNFNIPLGNFAVLMLSLLGLILTVWAIMMLLDHIANKNILFERLKNLEIAEYGNESCLYCYANKAIVEKSSVRFKITRASAVALMLIMLIWWFSLWVAAAGNLF